MIHIWYCYSLDIILGICAILNMARNYGSEVLMTYAEVWAVRPCCMTQTVETSPHVLSCGI
jgi:hypothetical protein